MRALAIGLLVAGAALVAAPARPDAACPFDGGEIRVVAGSEAGFDLEATMHTVKGRTNRVTGVVRGRCAADGSIAFEAGSVIEVEAASLDTGNPRRDRKLREESLETATHPTIAFVPERAAPAVPPPGKPGALAWEVHGRLAIRGVERAARVVVTTITDRGALVVDGTFEVAWGDFSVPDPSVLFLRVQPSATAWFRLRLGPSATAR